MISMNNIKNHIKLIALFFIINTFNGYAQEGYSVIESNIDSFPNVKLKIQMKENVEALDTDFKISDENGEALSFTMKSIADSETATTGRLIYFLIDASLYTDGLPINNMKLAVKEAIGKAGDGDYINLGYFGHERNDGDALTSAKTDFTDNFELLDSEVERINAGDSTQTDIYKAIFETIELMKRSDKSGQKILIVISGAVDNKNSVYNAGDIAKQANKNGTRVYTINYKINNQFSPDPFKIMATQTDGSSMNVTKSVDIKNAISDFLDAPAESEDNAIQQYEFLFALNHEADGKPHHFKIEYRQEPPFVVEYNAPTGDGTASTKGRFFQKYWLIILVVVGILAGLGYWQYNEMMIRKREQEEEDEAMMAEQEAHMKKLASEKESAVKDLNEKNIRLQEQLRMKEQELAKKMEEVSTVIPPQKHDLKNTIIGGGGGSPIFKVAAGAFAKNFRLNKPIMTIGRAANNDIVVPEQTVSSQHATITIENGSFFLNDLNSTNGTFVNGTRIDKKILKSGDLIQLGGAQCKFEI
jgi:hypothetical protein